MNTSMFWGHSSRILDQCCWTSLSVTWTVGSSAPSVCWQHQAVGWSWHSGGKEWHPDGPGHISQCSTRLSARSFSWAGTIRNTNTGGTENELRAALKRKIWVSLHRSKNVLTILKHLPVFYSLHIYFTIMHVVTKALLLIVHNWRRKEQMKKCRRILHIIKLTSF